MTLSKIIFAALSMLGAGSQASASLSIDSIAFEIASQSPAVLADKGRLESVTAEISSANTLRGAEVDFDYKFAGKQDVENRWSFSVGQEFDWPGVYGARKEAGRKRVGALEQLYQQTLADKAHEAKIILVDLISARESARTLAEVLKGYEELAEVYGRVFERGEITILDYKKLKLRIFDIRCRLAEEQATAESLENTLKAMTTNVNIPEIDLEQVPLRPLAPFDSYYQAMLSLNPGIKAYEGLGEVAIDEVKLARRSSLPSFKLSYNHDYEEGVHFNGFGISMSLPSWAPSKAVRTAKANVFAAENEALDYRLRTVAALRSGYEKASRLHALLASADNLFDDSFAELLRKSLSLGQISLYTYLNEYTDFIDAKLDYIGLRAEYAKAFASVDRYILHQ